MKVRHGVFEQTIEHQCTHIANDLFTHGEISNAAEILGDILDNEYYDDEAAEIEKGLRWSAADEKRINGGKKQVANSVKSANRWQPRA